MAGRKLLSGAALKVVGVYEVPPRVNAISGPSCGMSLISPFHRLTMKVFHGAHFCSNLASGRLNSTIAINAGVRPSLRPTWLSFCFVRA